MYLTVVTPDIANEVATSDKPWIYLAVVMIVMVAAGVVYVGKYLIGLDKTNREESKSREKHLLDHLDKQNACLEKITSTQNAIAATQDNISKDISDLRGRVVILEKFTYRKGGE